jgi:hypothetical protein
MRKVGLILENLDGFDRPGVMRGVPHVLGLRTSLTPAPFDGSTVPPEQRTGWSGDGAPGSGTLRDFATGAVTQHFTRTLTRANGVDFRLPNDLELDALEAFQLSLGRQAEIDAGSLRLKNPTAALGKRIFNNGAPAPDPTIAQGKCFLCHQNAGATVNGVLNGNFDTGVERLPAQPADLIDAAGNPPDGGFGRTPRPGGGFGDGRFNTPSLVEAADTGPFFHNNAIGTLEGAVDFYNSSAFATSPAAAVTGPIQLAATEVEAIAAFLRVLNVNQSIQSSLDIATEALLIVDPGEVRVLLAQSIEELNDAVDVLNGGACTPTRAGKRRRAVQRSPQRDSQLRNTFISKPAAEAETRRLMIGDTVASQPARDRRTPPRAGVRLFSSRPPGANLAVLVGAPDGGCHRPISIPAEGRRSRSTSAPSGQRRRPGSRTPRATSCAFTRTCRPRSSCGQLQACPLDADLLQVRLGPPAKHGTHVLPSM